jgi:peptidoglycan/xylan/chitin deacetylase (PgdA/CDA1 family)
MWYATGRPSGSTQKQCRVGHRNSVLCAPAASARSGGTTIPFTLYYHGVPRYKGREGFDAEAFEKQITFAKRRYKFISVKDLLTGRAGAVSRPMLLTFDDGFRNNAENAAPILRRHNVPATFFISSRHCTPGKYLWFSYLKAFQAWFPGKGITIDGSFISLSASMRERGMEEITSRLLALRPHPSAMYAAIETALPPLEEFVPRTVLDDHYEGMTREQIVNLARDPLFTIGGHTSDHPYLTSCHSAEIGKQISENKKWLEDVTGRPCDVFAYPLGDFNKEIMEQCRLLGFQYAFGVEVNPVTERSFAIQRVGVYSCSLVPLAIKISLGQWLPYRAIRSARKLIC